MKKILILGGGDEQIEIVQAAKNCKYKTIVLDQNPSAPCIKYADEFFQCNILSVEDVVKIGREVNADGLLLHAIDIPQVAAKISKELNFPGIDPNVAINATNKLKRLSILKKNNIACPNFFDVETLDEAKKASSKLGYPVVIKPIDNAGSRGVLLIQNQNELEKFFPISLESCKFEKKLLVEEHLEGPQISTESIIHEGRIYTTGFSDRNYSNQEIFTPYFIENGGDVPSQLPEDIQKKTIEVVEKTIKILGINFGPAKGDIVIHNGIPHILEMAPRTSGGRFASIQVPTATGVNILEILCRMAVNDKINVNEFQPKFNHASSIRFVIPKPGKIISIIGLNDAKNSEGVVRFITSDDLEIGQIVPEITDNSMKCKKVLVITEGNTVQESKQRAINACNKISIITESIK